ncbi:MAG: Crp/Fnr family transcriptional regulator [Cyclobacteriaceae bacterium]
MSGPFKALSPSELECVDRARTEITYKKGEILCKQGSFIANTIFVKKGLVKIYIEGADNPLIISLEKEGYFIGIPSLFGDGVFHYSAEALTDVQVCQVDINVYREMIRNNAEFAARVLQKANEDIVTAYDRMYSITHKQIHGRFAELLGYLSEDIYEANPFDLTLTRKDMAELIHSSPESVSRLMKEFRDDGLVDSNGHSMKIKDKDRLRQISMFG